MLRSLQDRTSRAKVLVAGFIALGATASAAPAAGANSFVDTTPGARTFTVPAGVHSLAIRATAGSGGNVINSYSGSTLVAGGRGALITATVAVSPGEQLQLIVATNGGNGDLTTATSGAAGAPDGGAGGYEAGGGGAATRVLSCTGVICPIAVVAAGGGGAGASGYIASSSGPFQPLQGGAGGDIGAKGGDGASDNMTGGKGGEPGTSGAAGNGGSGSEPGDDGNGSVGGAGGNQAATIAYGEGGGGGGGGVFGGGGGGSGANGMSPTGDPEYAGGGGGGGGSSLAPSGASVQPASPGAAPKIVLTWTVVVPKITGLTRSPEAFVAAPKGPSAIPANGGPGTKVDYTLNEAAGIKFTVLRLRPGRKAKGGRCVKPTKANRKAHKCTRLVAVPGSFTRPGRPGANSFRFTGRIAGHKLNPGNYRLVATPSVGGKTGRSASVSFRIVT